MEESSERVSLSLPYPRRGVSEKHCLRSPVSLQSTKFIRFPSALSTVVPVKMEKFCDFTAPRPLAIPCLSKSGVSWTSSGRDKMFNNFPVEISTPRKMTCR